VPRHYNFALTPRSEDGAQPRLQKDEIARLEEPYAACDQRPLI
jgi:hypothetical protein